MERIHVAAFPYTGSGHINPMLELSRHLVPLGFSVSLLLTENEYGKMESSKDEHIQFVSIPNPPHSSTLMSSELQHPVASILKHLTPTIRFVLSDFFIGWSQDLANQLQVPRIALVTCGATAEIICSNVTLLISKGYFPVNVDDENPITFLPHIGPLHPRLLPMGWRLAQNKFVPVLGRQLERMKEAVCILVNTVEELEHNVISGRKSDCTNYLPVGPLMPTRMVASSESSEDICINWLNKQAPRSVLYAAFGSVHPLPVDKVEMIAEALKKSGKPFIWALRRNFAKDAPKEFWERIAARYDEQGIVIEWAPQAHILHHISVAAFLTHCGWNSTLEALCSGVPTLCWPCAAEQNLNAFIMSQKWKIGLKVAEGDDPGVTVEEITQKIKMMMESREGAEMISRVQKLKSVVQNAHRGGSSYRNLQSFKNLLLSAKQS